MVGFGWFVHGGGARQWQQTVADESRNKMVDGVIRSPARLCSIVGKLCYYGRLECDFLAFWLIAPYFFIFFFLMAV